jgi:integrase
MNSMAWSVLIVDDHEGFRAGARALLEAEVSRALGHSTISTTADVYAHVTPATLQRSAERMDGILRRKAADSA